MLLRLQVPSQFVMPLISACLVQQGVRERVDTRRWTNLQC